MKFNSVGLTCVKLLVSSSLPEVCYGGALGLCNGALASARKVDLEGEQSGSTLALCVRALFVFASLLHSICVLIMFFSPLCLSASFPHVSMQERRKAEHLALSRVPNSLSFFCSDYHLPPNLTTRCPHRSAIPFHTEACKLLSRHIKREKMLLFFSLGQYSD